MCNWETDTLSCGCCSLTISGSIAGSANNKVQRPYVKKEQVQMILFEPLNLAIPEARYYFWYYYLSHKGTTI